MSGETAKPKTCVFWDVDDCPIPSGLDPNSIYRNIKSALANEGFDDILEFKAYGDKGTFADGFLLDVGITFVPKVTIHVRQMLFDICEWALVNPKGSNLLLISKCTLEVEDQMLVTTLECLAERGYNVLLALPDKLELPFTARSIWLWTSLSNGGSPIEPRGIKRKSSADILEPHLETLKPNFQNLFTTMSEDTASLLKKTGGLLKKTGVFWDHEDYPIHCGIEPDDATFNIECALATKGFPGNTSFRFYVQEQVFPDQILVMYKAGRIAFYPEIKEDQISRVQWILLHSYFWAIDNPVSGVEGEEHRLMIASRRIPTEPEFISVLRSLKLKGYEVLLVHTAEVEPFVILSPSWLAKSQFNRFNPFRIEFYIKTCPDCNTQVRKSEGS